MPDLSALIERLEGASGPDADLDARLFIAVRDQLGDRVRELMAGAQVIPLTASIDAALAFVERVLPGATYLVEKLDQTQVPPVDPQNRAFVASVGLPRNRQAAFNNDRQFAILIAALKALQEREGEG